MPGISALCLSLPQYANEPPRCPTLEPAFISMKMALEIWKWQLPWPLRISSVSVGNDFQQARGNQEMRHFQMSSTSTPTGDSLRWKSPAIQTEGLTVIIPHPLVAPSLQQRGGL
jgi:hypothetical protein